MEHLSFANTIEALRRQLNINANPMTMPDFNFSDSDICCDLGNDPEPKFLDEYTEEDFHKILNENGFIEDLKNLGYSKTILRMECKDKFVHRLSLLDRSLMTSVDQPITEKNFLMDMFMRKKDLVTYQLKAYQDLKYRANHMPANEAEELDILPDIPEKRKFKPDYMKDDRDKRKEKSLKLRNLSDFSKIDDNKLADNLKEADKVPIDNNSVKNTETENLTPSPTKSTTSYNFSMYSISRTFSLNRNPSSTHGSTVDVDVIEVSSASSYSDDDEETKNDNNKSINKNSNKSLSEYEEDVDDENEDNKSNSSLTVELHNEQDKNTSDQENLKTNFVGDKVDGQKLPLDPNTNISKNDHNHSNRVLRRKNKSKNENKHSSLDFSYFINSLTNSNNSSSNKRNNNQPPMTASSVINSIFSFLNNSIKEEKPIAPVIDTPKSPSLPESSQESSPETNPNESPLKEYNDNNNNNNNNKVNNEDKVNNDDKEQILDKESKNNEIKSQVNNNSNIIAPTPFRASPINNNLNSSNIDNKESNLPIITINNGDESNSTQNNNNDTKITTTTLDISNSDKSVIEDNNKKEIENSEKEKKEDMNNNENRDENVTVNENKDENNNTSAHSSRNNLRSVRSNAGMDMELQPKSPEEVRKRKLTPLLVSKKGAMVLIKFLERNINVVPEMKITEIEWVCMQNPRGTFTTKRPQCPGQRFPGLKMGRKISNLMISLAKLKGRDGLCDTPEHFHNAAIYSQKGYMFINPAFHGYFVSLLYDLNKDMREHGLAAVSWAFKLGHVINRKTKKPEFWHPEEQIYPTSDRLHKYFISDQYLALVEHYRKVHLGRVYIDWNDAKECLAYSIKIEQIQHMVFSDDENENEKENKENKNEEKIKEENLIKESLNNNNNNNNNNNETTSNVVEKKNDENN